MDGVVTTISLDSLAALYVLRSSMIHFSASTATLQQNVRPFRQHDHSSAKAVALRTAVPRHVPHSLKLHDHNVLVYLDIATSESSWTQGTTLAHSSQTLLDGTWFTSP